MRPRGTGGSLLVSHQEMINNSTAIQYSPLVGVILKISFCSCFVQHCSLKSPPRYLCTRILARTHKQFSAAPRQRKSSWSLYRNNSSRKPGEPSSQESTAGQQSSLRNLGPL